MPHPPGQRPYQVGSTKCLHSGQSFGSSSFSVHMPAGGSPTGVDDSEADAELLGSLGSLMRRQGQFLLSHFPGPSPFAINSFSLQHVSSPDRLEAYRDPPGPFPLEETGRPRLGSSGALRSPEGALRGAPKAGLRWFERFSRKIE